MMQKETVQRHRSSRRGNLMCRRLRGNTAKNGPGEPPRNSLQHRRILRNSRTTAVFIEGRSTCDFSMLTASARTAGRVPPFVIWHANRTSHVDLFDRTGFCAASPRRNSFSRRCFGLGVLGDGATIGAAPLMANGDLSSRRGLAFVSDHKRRSRPSARHQMRAAVRAPLCGT